MKGWVLEVAEFARELVAGCPAALKWAAASATAVWTYATQAESAGIVAVAAALIVLDVLTGLLASWVERKPIQSRVFGRTISKLVAFGSLILILGAIPNHIVPGGGGAAAADWSVAGGAGLVAVNEAISILENCVRIGLPLPPGLLERLRRRLGLDEPARDES